MTKPYYQDDYATIFHGDCREILSVQIMAKPTYSDKLKDPRWQKKRLEVLSAHDFTCEQCTEKELPLNVHHKRYIRGREYWEYDLDDLACLCEKCHKRVTEADKVLSGKSDSKAVRDEVDAFRHSLGLLLEESDYRPQETVIVIEFLNWMLDCLNLPSRFDFDLHERPLKEMADLVQNLQLVSFRELRRALREGGGK